MITTEDRRGCGRFAIATSDGGNGARIAANGNGERHVRITVNPGTPGTTFRTTRRARAYRWGEDRLAASADDRQLQITS